MSSSVLVRDAVKIASKGKLEYHARVGPLLEDVNYTVSVVAWRIGLASEATVTSVQVGHGFHGCMLSLKQTKTSDVTATVEWEVSGGLDISTVSALHRTIKNDSLLIHQIKDLQHDSAKGKPYLSPKTILLFYARRNGCFRRQADGRGQIVQLIARIQF